MEDNHTFDYESGRLKFDFHGKMEKLYPKDKLYIHVEKIEKMGYEIYPGESGCQIYFNNELLIDADFCDTLEDNLQEAIYCFYHKLK